MPCLWYYFKDKMLHRKTVTKIHLLISGSNFQISAFQTPSTRSKTYNFIMKAVVPFLLSQGQEGKAGEGGKKELLTNYELHMCTSIVFQ